MVILRDNGQDFTYSKMKQQSFSEMKNAHYHPYAEMYYLIHGTRKFFIGDTILTLSPGDLIMIPKGIVHRTTYISNDAPERITMSYSDTLAAPIIASMGQEAYDHIFDGYLIQIPAGRRDYFEELFQKMDIEHKSTDILSDLMLKNYLEEMLVFLSRCKDHTASVNIATGSDDATISAIAKYISKHFSEDISLEAVAKQFSISPTYLSKRFKVQTGFGFKEYLTMVRIMEASRLLTATTLSITEIASCCGFESSNYFGDAFKKSLGMSPRDYRKINS